MKASDWKPLTFEVVEEVCRSHGFSRDKEPDWLIAGPDLYPMVCTVSDIYAEWDNGMSDATHYQEIVDIPA